MIVGSGGREHALGWKLSQVSGRELLFAQGNTGTGLIGENLPVATNDVNTIVKEAHKRDIDLIVVGPENSLEKGLVDVAQEKGLNIFGPSQKAARLETSKSFASEFMWRHNIPSAKYHVSHSIKDAQGFIDNSPWPLVIKADGLAAGKGVILPESKKEAMQTVIRMMETREFGKAGETIIFQERLTGSEVSIIAFSDGKTIVPLLPSQDYKRINDNDQGPNTGGMGTYAPVPFVNTELMQQIHSTILQPTVDGMGKEGNPYKGVLYAGLMLTENGPKVLEFNARFGDPETQPLMMLLQSELAPILLSCIKGTLEPDQIQFRPGAAVCVILSSKGYPKNPEKGKIITGLKTIKDPNVQIFHAGTITKDGRIVTNGGRVLGITTYGEDIASAAWLAYLTIGKSGVMFDGMHYRRDIGKTLK